MVIVLELVGLGRHCSQGILLRKRIRQHRNEHGQVMEDSTTWAKGALCVHRRRDWLCNSVLVCFIPVKLTLEDGRACVVFVTSPILQQ